MARRRTWRPTASSSTEPVAGKISTAAIAADDLCLPEVFAMMKLVFAAALAAVINVPEAAAQSLVQRSDWQDRKLETYLPRVKTIVPWLEMGMKTRLPKGDIPLGRDVASVGRFVLPSRVDVRITTISSA